MSNLWIRFLSIFALVLIFSFAQAAPQDDFLQIYLSIQEADQLNGSGQGTAAREKYQLGLKRLEELQKKYPDWEPVIVRYRINFCKDKIGKLANAVDSEDKNASSAPTTGDTNTANPNNTQRDDPTALQEDTNALKARIRQLESELGQTKKQLAEATADAAQLRARQEALEKQIAARGQAPLDGQIHQLLEENQALRQQLDQARQEVSKARSEDLGKLQEQLAQTQQQLAAATTQVEATQKISNEYKQQLEAAQARLANTPTAGAGAEPVLQENQLLRNIMDRALKNQARHEAAKKLAVEELVNLKVDATTLKNQIEILSSPVVDLSPQEKELLRLPEANLVVEQGGHISTTLQPAQISDYATKPKVPDEFRQTAELAVQLFSQRRLDEAATQYQSILNAYPDSLYALSNLGVVRFQQQKYAEAEKYLRKAIAQAPQDAFSHSILGIVLYQQERYAEAVDMLTRATTLDPNDPKTRNYLGISSSQKGWQDVAERECRKAVELDDKYADAHFNLAVIYATKRPPLRELARQHYTRAVELGVPKDDSLEQLLR